MSFFYTYCDSVSLSVFMSLALSPIMFFSVFTYICLSPFLTLQTLDSSSPSRTPSPPPPPLLRPRSSLLPFPPQSRTGSYQSSGFLSLHRSPMRIFNLPVYRIDSSVVFPFAFFNMAIARLIAHVALKMDLSVPFGGGKPAAAAVRGEFGAALVGFGFC